MPTRRTGQVGRRQRLVGAGLYKNITNEAIVGVGSSGQATPGVWFKAGNATFRSASLEPPRTYGVRIGAEF